MAWTQTTYGFEEQTSVLSISGATGVLSGTSPFLRFTDTDSGHEDWRLFVDADEFKFQWLSSTGPDVFTDVLVFSDPAAATRQITLTDYALFFTGLDAAQVFLRSIVSSEANPRFRIDSNGKVEWGAGGASAVDTALERVAAAVLQTATIRGTVAPSAASDLTRKDYVDTSDNLRLLLAGGTMTGFITLHAAPSSNMHAATKLYVDDRTFSESGETMTGTLNFDLAIAGTIIASKVASEANNRFTITSAGALAWGAGGASAVDTSLSRTAADTLSMAAGDQFQVIGGSESAPGLAILGDANTGLRSSATDTLELVTAGADRWQISSAGHLLAVDANTNIYISGIIEIDGALDHDGSTVGFYGTTPVAQATASSNLTDNSGGTANDTIQALTDPADAPPSADDLRDDLVTNLIPELRNNYADLANKVNKALTILRDLGLMAT